MKKHFYLKKKKKCLFDTLMTMIWLNIIVFRHLDIKIIVGRIDLSCQNDQLNPMIVNDVDFCLENDEYRQDVGILTHTRIELVDCKNIHGKKKTKEQKRCETTKSVCQTLSTKTIQRRIKQQTIQILIGETKLHNTRLEKQRKTPHYH